MNKRAHFFILAIILGAMLSNTSCTTEDLPLITIDKKTPVKSTKEPCTITYTHDDKKVLLAEIKSRGGMSSKYEKNSFTLELERKYKVGNLPKDDDWILNASYIDKTFMRHKISYDLFREMNPENIASQCAYVTVNLKEQYLGLYVLMQEINASMIGLNKRDSMAMLFKDPPIFNREKQSEDQYSINYYQQKYPKIEKGDNSYYIEKFENFLFNSSDADFVKGISGWIDIDNVINWHLLLLFSNNGDGIIKNFYLYKKDAKTPFRIAIWDYDHSFGRDGDNELNMMERPLDCNRSILFKRLSMIKETNYNLQLKSRWFELRKQNIISVENFSNHIDQNHVIIHSAVKKNFEKWPVKSNWYFDGNTYEEEIELMLKFVQLRIEQLDHYFAKQ